MPDLVKGESCPWCHRYTVVYDGNYSCESCSWAMGDGNEPRRIVRTYLAQRWLEAEKAGDEKEMRRLGDYLLEYVE